MRANLSSWGPNPIIVKELRSRMRGARAFLTLTAMLILLALVSYGLYRMVIATSRYSGTPVSPQIGQALLAGLAFLELIMVCGITPAVTAGAISGEQEKQTYEMLMATPLRPASILWGKLVSALSYVMLLLFAGIPMASLVFIYGGVSARDMIKALVILVVVAILAGVIGLFSSALFRRTGRATVVSYAVMLLLLFGPLVAAVGATVLRQTEPPRWLLVPSPISALFSALAPSLNVNGGGSIFWMLGGQFWGIVSQVPFSQTGIPRPLYHYSLPLFAGLILVLYLLATRLVQPARRWRLGRKEILIWLVLLLGFAGLTGFFFWSTSDRYEDVGLWGPPTTEVAQQVMVERAVAVGPVPGDMSVAVPPPVPENWMAVPEDASMPESLPDEQMAQIYAAAIVQLLETEPDLMQKFGVQRLVIAGTSEDIIGDPEAPRNSSLIFSPEQQQIIQTALEAAGVDGAIIEWTASYVDAPRNANGSIIEQKALIVVSNIHTQADDSKLVSTAIYANSLGFGHSYLLSESEGGWQVDNEFGPGWSK